MARKALWDECGCEQITRFK
nr:hypothetical protein [Tanacetum cinerariifolium]